MQELPLSAPMPIYCEIKCTTDITIVGLVCGTGPSEDKQGNLRAPN